jgi:hypothetical protein
MQVTSFAVGKKRPIPAFGAALYSTNSGFLLLLPFSRLHKVESEGFQHGRLEFAFRVDGRLLHFGVRSKVCGALGLVAFDAPPPSLPDSDKTVSYLCTLAAVDIETRKVKALRPFTFSREISELLWRMSRSWSAEWYLSHIQEINQNLPSERELFAPPSIIWTLGAKS